VVDAPVFLTLAHKLLQHGGVPVAWKRRVRSKAAVVACAKRLKPYLEPIRDIRVDPVNDTYAVIENINGLVGLQRGLEAGID
jgi:hypothetical protein